MGLRIDCGEGVDVICAICGRDARYKAKNGWSVCGYHRVTTYGDPRHKAMLNGAHARKLTWFHGPDRALAILLGQDEATNVDIEAWRGLGTWT